ncbi:MAG: hypothetical protein L3J06_04760 [Cyclobacteriaceae bacterium]|nr:hypothetical protein [Cyclobacteriaceae bacterium]
MSDSIISFSWNDSTNFLKCDAESIEINADGKTIKISFSYLVSIHLNSKKKLAPLIIGVVLASLALVNILLEGASLSMIGFLSLGLLILYFGSTDYWVIRIDQFSESTPKAFGAIWISKNKCPKFSKTFINIIDFKISKGFFPPLYAIANGVNLNDFINNTPQIALLAQPLKYYLTPPILTQDQILIKVDVSNLNFGLEVVVDEAHWAIGKYKINEEALILQ